MHKKFIFVFVLVLFGFFCFSEVNAMTIENVQYSLAGTSSDKKVDTCEEVLGDPNDDTSFAYFLNEILKYVKYLGPALCLVLSIVEFVKAAASQEKEMLTKAFKKTVIRVILALVLFFIPLLVNFILGDVLGWYGTCGIE